MSEEEEDIPLSEFRDEEFRIEKLLVKHGLWSKVEKHKDLYSCPLCKRKFEVGDLAMGVLILGKPIHVHCIEKLEKKE